ncbi:response regulator [Fundidesulfovibrio butyratiphilus]
MTQKPKILFVDDEPFILDGLRLMLRDKRPEWDMAFVQGSEEALKLLDRFTIDVVVTDLRMPGLDGAGLLAVVRDRHPGTARIVLSGYSDQETSLRTVKLAHQYLSKPIPPETLKQAIAKALGLRHILGDPNLKHLILGIDSLPSLPPIYTRLTMALEDDNAPLSEIGDIISQDVGMSANILRLVNSAFFGLPAHVSSIHHAVNLLGTDTIRSLVLSLHLFSAFDQKKLPGFSLGAVWEHSTRVSGFAKTVAEVEGMDRILRDDCFIAGMLHDVGKLILAQSMPKEYATVLELADTEHLPMHLAEYRLLGSSHAEIGAYLINTWGFPDSIVETLCWHHTPERVDCAACTPLMAVAVANAYDHCLSLPQGVTPVGAPEVPCIAKEEYMVHLSKWQNMCKETFEKTK